MTYTPLQLKQGPLSQKATSFMAVKGENRRDLPQLLDPSFALKIKNFIIYGQGGLLKRRGLSKIEEVAGANAIQFLEVFDEDTLIYAYADKVAAYNFSSDTSTVINTYATTSTIYSGDRYGGYFFVTNGQTNVARISRTLAYDGQTANFTAGKILTGTTSGATATILQDADSGATGTLTLGYIDGVFQDNELITDSAGGSATANGTINWVFTSISGSPICKVLKAIGPRLYAGNLDSDETAVWYSNSDTGTNPPFSTWTVGTNAADPGTLYFRNAGPVNDIEAFGQNIIVVGSEFGKWAFNTTTIDSAGTLKKVDNIFMQKIDAGVKKFLYSESGLYFVNKVGLWKVVSLGQLNVPFSEQEQEVSVLLGNNYFEDFDFSKADIVDDMKRKLIMVTCAKDSEVNNHVLVYHTEFNAFTYFDGWNVSQFATINGTIYAASAIATKLYEVFGSQSDDGNDIWCEFYQELKMGGLETLNTITKFYAQGYLSSSSNVAIEWDIYDQEGNFVYNKSTWEWTVSTNSNLSDGFGVASWGTSSWGGDVDVSTVSESFSGCAVRIANFQRIRIRIKEHSKLPLIINWFSAEGRTKMPARRRNILKIS